jgi:hypothetical protein
MLRMSTLDEQSDAELLRRYQDESADDDGEPFMAIYMRYRDTVRTELEAGGLSPADAENRVGAVFIRALNDSPQRDEVPLRERLFALAREIGGADDWHPL